MLGLMDPFNSTKPPWSGLQLCAGVITMLVWCVSNSLHSGLTGMSLVQSFSAPFWTHKQIKIQQEQSVSSPSAAPGSGPTAR